jgi:hypothetical protein
MCSTSRDPISGQEDGSGSDLRVGQFRRPFMTMCLECLEKIDGDEVLLLERTMARCLDIVSATGRRYGLRPTLGGSLIEHRP